MIVLPEYECWPSSSSYKVEWCCLMGEFSGVTPIPNPIIFLPGVCLEDDAADPLMLCVLLLDCLGHGVLSLVTIGAGDASMNDLRRVLGVTMGDDRELLAVLLSLCGVSILTSTTVFFVGEGVNNRIWVSNFLARGSYSHESFFYERASINGSESFLPVVFLQISRSENPDELKESNFRIRK
jgi:hypothetical protein